jgi:hypothetical protein
MLQRTTVNYNRSAKVYQVITPDGEIIAEFNSGPENKMQAEAVAVQLDAADIHQAAAHIADIFRNRPDVLPRVWKAARIAADCQVYEAHPLAHNTAYHVGSQGQPGQFYAVKQAGNRYECDCDDCNFDHAPIVEGQKICKHIMSIKIMKAAGRQPPPYPNSPRDLLHYLDETRAAFLVIGAYNRRFYPYAHPQRRRAATGEVVQDLQGETWRVIGGGQKVTMFPADIVTVELDPAASPELDPIEQQRMDEKREHMSRRNYELKEALRRKMEQAEITNWQQRRQEADDRHRRISAGLEEVEADPANAVNSVPF